MLRRGVYGYGRAVVPRSILHNIGSSDYCGVFLCSNFLFLRCVCIRSSFVLHFMRSHLSSLVLCLRCVVNSVLSGLFLRCCSSKQQLSHSQLSFLRRSLKFGFKPGTVEGATPETSVEPDSDADWYWTDFGDYNHWRPSFPLFAENSLKARRWWTLNQMSHGTQETQSKFYHILPSQLWTVYWDKRTSVTYRLNETCIQLKKLL